MGVLNRYREILALPGAWQFALAGLIARAPMSMVGISIILAVRALYGNYSLAGLVSAMQVISYAFGAPVLARLVDRYGQRQVMLPSIMVSALATVGLIFAILNTVPALVLVPITIVMGASAGSIGALARSRWAYVCENPGQLQVAYAMEAALDELVFVLGPVAATLLAATVHPLAGLWVAVVLMVGGAIAFLLQTSTQPPVREFVEGEKKQSVMRHPVMIVLALTYVFTGALFGSSDLAVVAFADEVNRSSMAGIILASMSLGSLLSALVYGARVWRTPMWRLFIVGVIAIAVGTSTFIFTPNLGVLAILMFLAGIAIAPTMTNVNTIVQRVTPPARLTEGLTWMSTAMTMGVSLGSALTGPAIDSTSHRGGFALVMLFGWLMVAVALIGLRTLKRALDKKAPALPELGGPDAEHLQGQAAAEHRGTQDTSMGTGSTSASIPKSPDTPTGFVAPQTPASEPQNCPDQNEANTEL